MSSHYPISRSEHLWSFQPKSQSPFMIGCVLFLFGILIPLLITACKSEQPADPIAVWQEASARIVEGDVDGYIKYLSNDAVYIEGSRRFDGTEEIREYLINEVMPEHLRFEMIDPVANGNDVTYTVKVYQGEVLIDTLDDVLTVVVDGKIIFEGTENARYFECITEPSQAFCPKE